MEFIVNYKSEKEIIIFSSTDEISEYLGNIWKEKTDKLNNNEYYSIALSGGSTPLKIFKYLSKNFNEKIDWNKIKFFWGDERCVPPEDPESNYKLAKENLFENIQISKENIYRIKGEAKPDNEDEAYSKVLEANLQVENGYPKFDFVLLGLGEDGHTASIFPNQINLFNSSNYCEVAVHPESKQRRITITGNIINNAETIMFIAVGKNKAEKVYEILNNLESSNHYPAALVNPTSGNLVWLLDKESAELL